MTKQNKPKRHKLSYEILGLLAVSFIISLLLFQILLSCGIAIIESFCFTHDIVLTDTHLMEVDSWVFNLSILVSVAFFTILFLFLLGDRLVYIRKLIKGIDTLRTGNSDYELPLEGNNELTQLAEEINYLSATQRQIKEKERLLNEEKELLIRTLSHDIRTPLTSIVAYSEFLSSNNDCSLQERKEYLKLIRKKAEQINELTGVLLDGGNRKPERFEDSRLLMVQLASEFEETLEDEFILAIDLSECPSFTGTFDVQELRRIFDNLASNIFKYADSGKPVTLRISKKDSEVVIYQKNHIRSRGEKAEGHQIGLGSIRRIAHNYGGRVDISQEDDIFAITITLSDI